MKGRSGRWLKSSRRPELSRFSTAAPGQSLRDDEGRRAWGLPSRSVWTVASDRGLDGQNRGRVGAQAPADEQNPHGPPDAVAQPFQLTIHHLQFTKRWAV